MPILRTNADLPLPDLLTLYEAVGWTAYTRQPSSLAQAIASSTFVVTAWEGDRLVGLARCLSDEVAICYLQDVLVHPDFQGAGVGRQLMTSCLERFAAVRTHLLLTDDEPRQRAFYASLGYSNTRELTKVRLNAFVQMKGVDLA